MRLLALAYLCAAPLLACFCRPGGGGPCSIGTTSVVFVGKVVSGSGPLFGKGAARVMIEEPLFNVPDNLRVVEVGSQTGGDCSYRFKRNERHVIYAAWQGKPGGRLVTSVCARNFQLPGNEHILEALRITARGGPSRLTGFVQRSSGSYRSEGHVSGATVVARSELAHYEALTDASGLYLFPAIAPGRYQLEVSKTGFLPDEEFNHRWSGRLVLNKETNMIEPDKNEPRGSVTIHERSCNIWDLRLWPHGRISGTVTGVAGVPLPGITVQAFAFGRRGEREISPLRSAVTGPEGHYVIEPLPGGEYIVGVNGESYSDADPYPPAFFHLPQAPPVPSRVRVQDGEETASIDVLLREKRVPATVQVQVLGPNGMPTRGATVELLNLSGVTRWRSKIESGSTGIVELPAYLGESYVVQASKYEYAPSSRKMIDFIGKSPRIDVASERASVTVTLAPRK